MDFNLLDDVLPERDALSAQELRALLRAEPVRRLGPLVEYAYVQAEHGESLLSPEDLPASPVVQAFLRARAWRDFSKVPVPTSTHAEESECCWVPPTSDAFDHPCWKAFRMRLQDAGGMASGGREAWAYTGPHGAVAIHGGRGGEITGPGGREMAERRSGSIPVCGFRRLWIGPFPRCQINGDA
jgi:hypothetical protein